MNAKISHHSLTIGRRDDAGAEWVCPDSTSKHSGGNDSSGSCSHNSESGHNGESSGEENGNGSEKRGGSGAYNAKTKVQLCTGNEYRVRTWGQPEKAVGGGGLDSRIPGIERRDVRWQDASDGRRSESGAQGGSDRGSKTAAGESATGCGCEQDRRRSVSGRQ